MRRSARLPVHIDLSTRVLPVHEREEMLASIAANAPKSSLYKGDATIQATTSRTMTARDAFATSSAAVDAARGLLASRVQTVESRTAALDRALLALKALVEGNAAAKTDVSAMGFTPLVPRRTADPRRPPTGILVVPSRRPGVCTVMVRDEQRRRTFAAQVSGDPIGETTWADLPGAGKRRTLTGYPPGTVLWVRFAALLGDGCGAWGTAVCVIMR